MHFVLMRWLKRMKNLRNQEDRMAEALDLREVIRFGDRAAAAD